MRPAFAAPSKRSRNLKRRPSRSIFGTFSTLMIVSSSVTSLSPPPRPSPPASPTIAKMISHGIEPTTSIASHLRAYLRMIRCLSTMSTASSTKAVRKLRPMSRMKITSIAISKTVSATGTSKSGYTTTTGSEIAVYITIAIVIMSQNTRSRLVGRMSPERSAADTISIR